MKTEMPNTIVAVTAAAALSKHRFCGSDGNYCGANARAVGVLNVDVASGDQASVATAGIVLVESGGAITVTTAPIPVASDSTGRAVAATAMSATVPGSGTAVTSSSAQPAMTIAGGYLPQAVNGYALDSATGSGEFVRVKLA